jgi:ribonuclease HI
MTDVTIYTDGACRGNPGPGGYGCLLLYTDPNGQEHKKEISAGYRLTTNNRMEIMAVIAGLELLKVPCRVELYSDSQYVVNAVEKGWAAKWQRFGWYKDSKHKEKAKNEDLWKRLLPLLEMHQVTFHWVKGHADNDYNNRCDALAVAAAQDKQHLLEDHHYQAG